MRTIAVVNQKGGCGKTTISINLSSALAELGHKTLLIDMDPQSHCAVGLAVPEEQVEQSIYDVLISKSRNEPIRLSEILWQISDNLELAPASIDLSAFEQQMTGIIDREMCLKYVLESVKSSYDYVIIDCPPAVGLLTFNALRSASDVIVPVETGYFALHGLSKQLETLSILCQRCDHNINVKVLASMYDIRTKMAREILSELRTNFSEKMFKTTVNFNTKIKEASSFGQPICEYDPASKGQMDFNMLAQEIVQHQVKKQKHEIVNSLTEKLDRLTIDANELLKTTKPARPQTVKTKALSRTLAATETIEPETVEQPKQPLSTKLSDFYGVSQVNDAVMFVTLYPHAKNVAIAGDFNNWQPKQTDMTKVGQSGVWQTKMNLNPGRYRYRLVVDGQWQQDPYNEMVESNPFGEHDSILEVN